MIKNKKIIIVIIVIIILIGSIFFLTSIFRPETDPIHDAVLNEDITNIEKLLNKGVSVDKTDARGRTPLYWAALQGSKEVAEYLISKGAQINKGASWKDDNTPIHVAASEGHTDMVALLIDKGANVNSLNRVGHTPLHLAAWRVQPSMVELLLNRGANANSRDNRGYTPLHVENIFQESGDDYTKIVSFLLDAGADVNVWSTGGQIGYTPLMGACTVGNKEVVDLLIAHGANVNARSKDGVSPLSLAISYEHKEIEEVLRKHGAKMQ